MGQYVKDTYVYSMNDCRCYLCRNGECIAVALDSLSFPAWRSFETKHVGMADTLRLELSEGETLITNAQNRAQFLGYGIYVRKSNQSKRDNMGRLKRDYVGRVVLEVNTQSIRGKLLDLKAIKLTYVNGTEIWKPLARYSMKDNDDLEILDK